MEEKWQGGARGDMRMRKEEGGRGSEKRWRKRGRGREWKRERCEMWTQRGEKKRESEENREARGRT